MFPVIDPYPGRPPCAQKNNQAHQQQYSPPKFLFFLVLGGLLNVRYFLLHSCNDHTDLTMLEPFPVIRQYQTNI